MPVKHKDTLKVIFGIFPTLKFTAPYFNIDQLITSVNAKYDRYKHARYPII